MTLSDTILRAFERVLSPADVISDPVRCRAYECDGLTGYRVVPELVLLPRDAAQVAAAVRICAEHRVPYVARGAGTGLSGGANAVDGCVVVSTEAMREIHPYDDYVLARGPRGEGEIETDLFAGLVVSASR
jgi:glycolate oxidase